MNKTLLTIATFGLLTLFSSAYYSTPADSKAGYKAPDLQMGNNNDLSPLRQHRGEMVLLTFWSSVDVQSRLANLHYDRLSRQSNARYTHITVNMDRSASVFDGIVMADGLNRATSYHSSVQAQENLMRAWRLEDGFHSFLIDPQGVIVAVDPDDKTLNSLN